MTEGHTERLESALAGRYKIERKLGEGGMASVYLAEDLKHERKVALKILRPELAAVIGADRFLSEIKTTANLQHPHILPLFDSGEASGYLYYVMPYIDGETLRDKLDREKQLGVEESLRIARDVADALDYAHRAGVIHRDIKPGNVLLHDGRPVVADFGIALAVSAAGGGRMTETGLSLGTPHYMSPEQASADRDLSVRSDVYSLGCVLYEMIAGQPPHTGPSAQSILVRILTENPRPLTQLRHTVPPNVAAAVTKSIEKLPADRFESAKAFREALDDGTFTYQAVPRVTDGAGTLAAAPPADPTSTWQRNRRLTPAGLSLTAAAFFAALAAWGWLRPAPDPAPRRVARFTFVPPATAPAGTRGNWRDIAVSPDGRFIAYSGPAESGAMPQLNLRALDDLTAAPLRGTDFAHGPFFSPDGEWVGFTPINNSNTLQRVSVLGGSPVTLAEADDMIHGASWGRDHIVFGTMNGGLFRTAAGGGEPEPITTLDTEMGDLQHVFPHIIEGREAVVFTIVRTGGSPASGELAVLDMASGEVTDLGVQGIGAQYVPSGHLVYVAEDQSLRAVPFDVESLTVTGSAVPLLDGIVTKPNGAVDFDISADGQLVYLPGSGGGEVERPLLWVDRAGGEESIGATPLGYVYARVSPDGGRVAVDDRDGDASIWIWDVSAGNLRRLGLGEGPHMYPVWSPDGERLAYSAPASDHLHWKASNNTGQAEVLAEDIGGAGSQQPEAYFFTPDGEFLVLRQQSVPETADDLIMIEVGGDGTPVWRLAGEYNERNAVLSPDGRWMAYQSDESGTFEVYVRPFPDVESDQVLVSNNNGGDPLWSPDGTELFYLQYGAQVELISVAVETGASDERFRFGARTPLLEWPYYTGGEGRNYDIAPDGERFVVVGTSGLQGPDSPDLHVVLNWFEELRERMGSD